MRRRAFSLIELLVVVTIIALLVALLLPSMRRAVEIARMVTCKSRQHQLSLSMLSYADDNMLRMPLGYVSRNIKHGNYYLCHNLGPVCMLGVLYNTGYVAEPRLFYCPGADDGQEVYTPDYYIRRNAFDNGKIVWQNMTPDNAIRNSYLSRPAVQWDDVSYLRLTPRSTDETNTMPRLRDYAAKAVISCSNYDLDDPHLGSVVATFGDGSVRYISSSETNSHTGESYSELADKIRLVGHLPANNTNVNNIWKLYDGF